MYGLIKQYGNDDWCLKAILKFWSIIYNSNGTAYSTKAIELAKANRTWIEIVRDETAELLKQNPVTLQDEKVNSVWAYFDKDKNRLKVSYDFNFGDYRYEVYIEGIENEVTDPKEVAKIILDTLQDKNKGAIYSIGW
jgi:spermidine/putrescine-binding protein